MPARQVFALTAIAVILLGAGLAADTQWQTGETPTQTENATADIVGQGLQVTSLVVPFLGVVAVLAAIGVLGGIAS